MKSHNQEKAKKEVLEFIKKNKALYSRRISTYKKEELMNAFYCRELFFNCERAIKRMEINSMEFDNKKLSDSQKRTLRNKFMQNDSNKEKLKTLSTRIENLDILKQDNVDLIIWKQNPRQAVQKLTFERIFNESRNAHPSIKEHMRFLEACHACFPFTPNDYPNARSANPELSSVFNKINHLTSQIIPDNYPYSTEMASLSNLWITIDLRYSDYILSSQIAGIIKLERQSYPKQVQNDIDNWLSFETIKRKLLTLDTFVIIDALILSAAKGVILKNTEINNSLNSSGTELRNIKNAIDYFMDILSDELDNNEFTPH
ncbi:hypothetical protein ENKOMM257B_24175 [Enterobacter kobei]|jgi:hypothetical protein|nr:MULTISPECIES: hypothetical protein [Enterobacteriaceae]AGE85453.1 hypothetical protein CSSP291_04280 [Cronobacter sakazakii SP291]CAE6234317.1 hypothetical protein AI2705V1_1275 [Enterobacter cloacae]SSW82753.1 Uncharacterised protein [Klebsiella pneumoniae]MDM2727085.1 hypothetical protein [Citrobacter sp. Cy234]CAE7105886.1 hypothetical protein AI2694V1_3264 [Enterobacter cloacae]